MARSFPSLNGDKCDSDYERAVVDDLIERGIEYRYEDIEHRLYYTTPVTNGVCLECGAVTKGKEKHVHQARYRTLDLYLPSTDILVEIKGKFPGNMRSMMREMIKCNKDVDIRFFFMADTWQTKGKKRTLMDWANAQGIIAAVGDPRQQPHLKAYGCGGIPESWVV